MVGFEAEGPVMEKVQSNLHAHMVWFDQTLWQWSALQLSAKTGGPKSDPPEMGDA